MSSKKPVSKCQIGKSASRFGRLTVLLFLCICGGFSVAAAGQKIAFLTPEKTLTARAVHEKIAAILANDFKLLDESLAESVVRGSPGLNPYNLSTEEAQNLGRAMGCDFFVVEKAETLRRASLESPEYYESYAVIYLVSARTGRLIFWKLSSFSAPAPAEAEKGLAASVDGAAAELSANLKNSKAHEIDEKASPNFTELPAGDSPEAKSFRAPLPYRRFRPEYTTLANLYKVAATVDALVDLDESGTVVKVQITRWAGYGLDEAVRETIRKMEWQPALREGKPLPIRVLLRYNFKKIEIEE